MRSAHSDRPADHDEAAGSAICPHSSRTARPQHNQHFRSKGVSKLHIGAPTKFFLTRDANRRPSLSRRHLLGASACLAPVATHSTTFKDFELKIRALKAAY